MNQPSDDQYRAGTELRQPGREIATILRYAASQIESTGVCSTFLHRLQLADSTPNGASSLEAPSSESSIDVETWPESPQKTKPRPDRGGTTDRSLDVPTGAYRHRLT
jgi:hypothetical protein